MTAIGDLHHVGITVRDLEASLQWYERTFGVEREFVAHGEGPALAAAVGVPDVRLDFAFLRLGGCVLELLCYPGQGEQTFARSNADVGSAHVCIDVPDLQASYERLRSRGVEFLTPPLAIEDGPLAGCAFVYFTDPDGVTLELFQTAGGRP